MSGQQQAPAVFLIMADDYHNQTEIFGARHDFIRALKIVNRLNEWTVDAAMREQHRGARLRRTPPWPRHLFSQPYYTETVAVR